MTLRARRLLYITCILIFILTAPPLVLYTAGWRFDFTYRRLVETGSLVVKSNPAKADVFLNNELYKEKTPIIINNILPGKINLEVKREGYHTWQKTVIVGPRLTTFVENIRLFLNNSPRTLIVGPIKDYWWNRKQDKIVYLNAKNQLRLYNTLNGKDTFLVNLANKPLLKVAWSPHDDQFLVSRGTALAADHFIIDTLSTEKFINLREMTNLNLFDVQWDEISSNTLYGLSGGALYRLPYLLKTTRLVMNGPVQSYLVEKGRIVFIERQTKKNVDNLGWIEPADPKMKHYLASRTDIAHDTLQKTSSRFIAVGNSQAKTLTIFDPEVKSKDKGSVLELYDIQKAIWSNGGSKLIYTDSGAIYQQILTTYLTDKSKKATPELITRYSRPIEDVIWSDDSNHLFYRVENTLRVLEIGPAAEPRSLTLFEKAANIKKLEFTHSAKTLTFIDSQGDLLALPIAAKEERTFLFGD